MNLSLARINAFLLNTYYDHTIYVYDIFPVNFYCVSSTFLTFIVWGSSSVTGAVHTMKTHAIETSLRLPE